MALRMRNSGERAYLDEVPAWSSAAVVEPVAGNSVDDFARDSQPPD